MSTRADISRGSGPGFSIGTVSLLTGLVALGVLIIAGNAADPMMGAHA